MNGLKIMDKSTEFIAAAVHDIQATIRAVDVKIGALLTAVLLPFAAFGRVWAHFSHLLSVVPSCFGLLLTVIFYLTWALAVFVLVRSLAAIDNPAIHISNCGACRGSFYGGGIYKLSLVDALFNRSDVKSSIDVAALVANAPKTEDEIAAELAFEQLKVVYIRDIKIHRLNVAINIAFVWVFIGLASFFISKVF